MRAGDSPARADPRELTPCATAPPHQTRGHGAGKGCTAAAKTAHSVSAHFPRSLPPWAAAHGVVGTTLPQTISDGVQLSSAAQLHLSWRAKETITK